MNKQFNLAYFAGGSKFTIDPFLALLASKHKVKIVFTKEPKRSGRGRKKTHNYLIGEVIKKNIKFIALDNFLNLENIKELNTLDLDFIIVFSFGVILPKEILDIPKYGCINLHTSILPKWRGASPIQHTLLNNEKYAGYSLFIMNEKLDEGDIIFKEKILIEDRDNYEILLNKIIKLASKSLVIKIEEFVNNNINIEKQDSNSATYCYRIRKEDTYISLNSSSKEVYGKIRAFSPSPGAKFFLQGELIKILEAKIEDEKKVNIKYGVVVDKNLLISCKYGFIRLIKIQREGRKAMLAKDFLNGWNVKVGTLINEKK